MRRLTALMAMVLLAGCGGTPGQEADLVLRNGHVVTVDSTRPEAEAVAVLGKRIMAVGSNREISDYIGPETQVIDLDGRLAIPAFIEGHAHFMGLGESKLNLDLTTAANWAEIVDMVAAAAADAEPGEWILGRGWHQEKWNEVPDNLVEGVPTHRDLDAVAPDNPVVLTHASGHSVLVNAAAMRLAGIDRNTPSPEGGAIVHDGAGNPTGLLRDNAESAINRARARAQADQTDEEREAHFREVVQLAAREALSKGIATFHDAGESFATIDGFRRMAEAGELPIRLYVMISEDNDALEARLPDYRWIGLADDHLTVRAIKRWLDGALGSHSAWLLEPYTDMPNSTGLNTVPIRVEERTAQLAMQYGFQLNTHAIGDRANRETLDVYERAYAAHPEVTDPRWRVEHAQHIDPTDIPRFGELGVIASMQGIHATSDMPWVPSRLGEERASTDAYRWQDLWQSGAVVTNGTDAPVEDVDPIPSFWATVARELPDGTVFQPDQRLSRDQALRAYTLNNAYSAFQEDLKGSLTPGKLADITVLSRDIMTIPVDEIRDAVVDYTIVGGRVAYDRQGGG